MTKRKKIGILTFCNTLDNYGQVLQYLATQEFLSKRGHDVFLYKSLGHRKISLFRIKRKLKKYMTNLFSLLRKPCSISRNIVENTDAQILQHEMEKRIIFQEWAEITERYEAENPRYFDEFRNKNFQILQCHYEDLRGFDSFAIGSDQMWSYLSEDTMLDFVSSGIHRFSIAPSVGHKIFTNEELRKATTSLSKFDFITVREQNGKEFCCACGRKDAQLILDPTFLLRKEDYVKFANPQGLKLPKRYVFIYLLGGEIEPNVSDMFLWAKKNDLDVVYVASQGRFDDFPKCHATIEQWLAALQNAEYVFTNSYHGMALSIIYRKPFLVFPLVGLMKGMNGRILHLSKIHKFEDRIFCGDFDIISKPIEWQYAEHSISKNSDILDSLLKTIRL